MFPLARMAKKNTLAMDSNGITSGATSVALTVIRAPLSDP